MPVENFDIVDTNMKSINIEGYSVDLARVHILVNSIKKDPNIKHITANGMYSVFS